VEAPEIADLIGHREKLLIPPALEAMPFSSVRKYGWFSVAYREMNLFIL